MPSSISFWVLVALLLDFVLGLLVFWTNRRRVTNQCFLTMSLILASWLVCLNFGFRATTDASAAFWIRACHSSGAFVPPAFNIMRLAILGAAGSWWGVIRGSRRWFITSALLAVLCQTPIFLTGAKLGESGTIAMPQFGPALPIYSLYFISALITVVVLFVKASRRSTGVQRLELQFVLLALAACLAVSITTAILIPSFMGSAESVRFAPIGVLLLHLIIAYGIATRRIMEVAHVLRLATAYALLTLYLGVVYAAVWFLSKYVLANLIGDPGEWPNLLAALVTALSVAPVHGRMQNFANRLFINVQSFNMGETIQKANRILSSITTLDDLLEQFSFTIGQAVGTDRAIILLEENGHFVQRYPKVAEAEGVRLELTHPISLTIADTGEPLVSDILQRMQPSPTLTDAGRRMAELHSAVAVGIQSKMGLEGVMLLGPRLSGRIYGAQEQSALQILCNNLAVALENAKLYTQVQDSAIYNNILLDNLVSGVIAVGSEHIVTVFNREAQRITGLQPGNVIGRTIESLPYPLAHALGSMFETGSGVRDHDVVLRVGDKNEEIPVRLGTALFRSHTGKILGALLVFNDLSTLRKLEHQVRRTDRLASLGTLSAGMAHEIKNPLVTLKTFTQLLPERYDDPDFRETFSSLLGQEVRRIDSLVNQLLRFARPTKPSLAPMHLHAVVENTLKLVHQQMRQKGLVMSKSLDATTDLIMGDNDLLVQALLNLLLNAIDAMEDRNELMVSTSIHEYESDQANAWGQPSTEAGIRLSIKDSGEGIRPEDIPHVFDPFFTTKSTGTGLGLSVAHGIIQEHRGVIDVESTLGLGTTFHIIIPLARKEATI